MEVPAPPQGARSPTSGIDETTAPSQDEMESLTASAVRDCEQIAARAKYRLPEADSDDFDLSTANAYKPSSMAVSLLVHFPDGAKLSVEATGGRYTAKPVMLAGRERDWWLRSPVRLHSRFHRANFPANSARYVIASEPVRENVDNLDVRIELFAKPYQSRSDVFLITICLINRQRADGHSILQSPISCAGSTCNSKAGYPSAVYCLIQWPNP